MKLKVGLCSCMETRSRKRAEGSSTAPSSSSTTPRTTRSTSTKRTRLSSISNSTSVAVNTRSRSSMDSHPANESSSGSRRDRRGKNHSDRDNSDKGKEKEHDVRVRDGDRDQERSLVGLNLIIGGNGGAGDDDDENDDDSDGEAGIFHENLTSASSALQGLLRKLGAGFDDLIPVGGGSSSSSHQNGRLKIILSELRADGEEGRQVEALTQLCEILSIGTEDSLSTFSVDSFVPVLVGLLNHEGNPDIMLLAARALTHLCDVLPSSCAAVVHYGAVPMFCARLLTIEYMDLAEQVFFS